MTVSKKRVLLAMSGGVDSSVCGWLLKERGYDVVGVTIKTWTRDECRDERSKGCCSIRDIDDARSVARKMDIPYYVMDLSPDFKEKVIDTFVDEYLAGRTPNPCIECNRHIKFGVLLQKAKELDASFVATGHYARKSYDETEGRYTVSEGVDVSKDQSYVLFGLSQEQLVKTLFPVGELEKTQVRAIAEKIGLRVFDKPDSQEICFVKKSYVDFVKETVPERLPGPGDLVRSNGQVVGRHDGFHEFTVGQRKRIRLTTARPYYVTDIDPYSNRVTVGFEEDLRRSQMRVGRVNWMLRPRTGRVEVKIRYKHSKMPASISPIDHESVQVRFDRPQMAITPGQAAVFYDGARVIGGGWIDRD
jgi:tRNA-specific 2-thiouridylase